jgi:hypothetical protein
VSHNNGEYEGRRNPFPYENSKTNQPSARAFVLAKARRGCRRHVPAPPSSLSMMYHYRSISCGGTPALVGHCRPVVACKAVSTIDLAACARWRRRRLRQGCLRCTSTCCGGMTDRAQMSDIVDSSRRAVQCRPSTSLPVHGGAAFVCANVAYDVPVLAVVIRRDERRCRTMSTRRGARCTIDHRCRCPCTVAPPPCAPRLPTMYQCSLSSSGGTSADVGQCRPVEARGAVSTIDVAASARWCRLRVRQGCLRCTSTRCRHSAGRAQMSDNVDSTRRAVQCRPSTSPPVRGGAAVVCAKVAHDVPVLAVVEWRTAHRCRTMSTRRGARCSVDHRPRRPCTVAPPSRAPRLPTMYQYALSSFGGTSADVAQCRLEARGSVSTIDLAARARWRRVVYAKVAHDVPVLAVIVWLDARRCWSMPTRRGARRSVD